MYIDSNMENTKKPSKLMESTSTLPVISVKALPRKHGKIVQKLFDEKLYCTKERTKQLVTILLNFDGTIFTVTGTNEQNAIQYAVSQLAEIIKGDKSVNQSTEMLQTSCEEIPIATNHQTNQMQPINIVEQNIEPKNMCPIISVKSLPKKSTKIVRNILNDKMYCIEESTEKLVTLSLNFDGTIYTVSGINAENAIRYAVSQLSEIIKGDDTVNQSTETLQSSCEEESVDSNHSTEDIIEPMQRVDKPENQMQPINFIEQNIEPINMCPLISVKSLPKKSTKIVNKLLHEKMYSVEESTEELVRLSLNFDGTIFTVTGTNEENAIRYAVSQLSEIIKGDDTVNQSTETLQSSCEEESVDSNHSTEDIIEPMQRLDKPENQMQPINFIEQNIEPINMCPLISVKSLPKKSTEIVKKLLNEKMYSVEESTEQLVTLSLNFDGTIYAVSGMNEENAIRYAVSQLWEIIQKDETVYQSTETLQSSCEEESIDNNKVDKIESLKQSINSIKQKLATRGVIPVLSFDSLPRNHAEIVKKILDEELYDIEFRSHELVTVSLNFEETVFKVRGNSLKNAIGNAASKLLPLLKEEKQRKVRESTGTIQNPGEGTPVEISMKLKDIPDSMNSTKNVNTTENLKQLVNSVDQSPKSMSHPLAPKYEETKKTPKGFIGKDMLIGKMPQMIVAEIYEKHLYTVVSKEVKSNQTLLTLSFNFDGEQISVRGNSKLNAISNAVNTWQRENSQQKSINISKASSKPTNTPPLLDVNSLPKLHKEIVQKIFDHKLYCIEARTNGLVTLSLNFDGSKYTARGNNELNAIGHAVSQLLKSVAPKCEETKKAPKSFIGKDMLIGKMPHMIVAEIYEKKLYTVVSTEVKSNQTLITLSFNFDGEQISVRGNSKLNAISNAVDSWWQRKRWKQQSINISKASSKPTKTPPLIAVSSLPKHHKEIVQKIFDHKLYCIEARTHGLVTLSLNFDGTICTIRGNDEKNAIGNAVTQKKIEKKLKVIGQEKVYKSPDMLQNSYGGISVDIGNKLPDISDSKNGTNNEKNMQEKLRQLSCFYDALPIEESPKSMNKPLIAAKYEEMKKIPKGFIGEDILIGKELHMIVDEIYEKHLYTVVSWETLRRSKGKNTNSVTLSLNFNGTKVTVPGSSERKAIRNAVEWLLQTRTEKKENNYQPTETLQNDSIGSPCIVNNKWPDILESVNIIDNSSNVDELEVGFKQLKEQPSRDIVISELMFEDMDLEQIVDEITTQNLCSKLAMKLLKSKRWMAFVSLNIDGKTYEGVGDSPRSAIEKAVCKWRFASESPTISDLPLELPKSCLGFVDKIKTTFKYDSGLCVAAIIKTVDMNFDSSEIVATAVSRKSLRMVCMGKNTEQLKGPLALNPNKCLRSVFLDKNSQVEPLAQSVRVIRDSRAVVLVKRCFRKYLYNQLYLLTSEQDRDKSIFCKTENSNHMFALKENVAFHLYLNFPPGESDQSTDSMKEKECISHADKMLLWNVLGVQGALLTPLTGPVFFESLILGCKAGEARITKIEHLLYERALEFKNLESPFNLHKLHIVNGTVADCYDMLLVHPHLSAAWTLGDKEPELVDPRTGLNENGIDLEIADYAFSKKYLEISKKFEDCPKITSALTYAEMKLIAKEYKAAKKSFLNELHKLKAKEGSKELCECRSTID